MVCPTSDRNDVAQSVGHLGLAVTVPAPADDCPIRFQCQAVHFAGGTAVQSPADAYLALATKYFMKDPAVIRNYLGTYTFASLADYQAGPGLAHAQDALFSMNHPMLSGIPFAWDVRDHDAIEVINTGWGLQASSYDAASLADWEAANGPASPSRPRPAAAGAARRRSRSPRVRG